MKKALLIAAALMACAATANAVSFVNGGFEGAGGNLDGWTIKGQNPGSITVSGNGINQYYGGAGGYVAATVTAGTDPNVPIQKVYAGTYSARIGDSWRWGGYPYQYNSLSQSAVANADATGSLGHLYFSWAAVLQTSRHSYYDTPYFQVLLKNTTTGADLYNVLKYEQDGGFWDTNGGWQYSHGNTPLAGWNIEDINLDAAAVSAGDMLSLTVLARDCNPTGHAMYVYLDGFGNVTPPVGAVPEPSTMLLLGGGLAGLAFWRKRKSA